jgi:tetratricopeptide (TPR) repeat protein
MFVLVWMLAGPAYSADPRTKKAAYIGKADAYSKDGKYAEAVIELKNAVQIDPNDAVAQYKLGLAYLQLGKQEHFPEALKAFESSIKHDPAQTEAQLRLGDLYLASGQLRKAQERAEAVLQNDAKNVEAYLILGNVYARQQNRVVPQ